MEKDLFFINVYEIYMPSHNFSLKIIFVQNKMISDEEI